MTMGKKIVGYVASLATVGAVTLPARAAIITVSDTAPTGSIIANPYDPLNVGSQVGYIDYTNNGSSGPGNTPAGGTGESFSVPVGGLTLNSFTVMATGSASSATVLAGATYAVDIESISNNNVNTGYTQYDGINYQATKVTSIDTESATGGALIAADSALGDTSEYITFTLSTPIYLPDVPISAYNFSITQIGNSYLGLAVTGNNAFTGGSDTAVNYNTGYYKDGSTGLGLNQVHATNDKVFYISGTAGAVPEPASILGMAGIACASLLSRRKRMI